MSGSPPFFSQTSATPGSTNTWPDAAGNSAPPSIGHPQGSNHPLQMPVPLIQGGHHMNPSSAPPPPMSVSYYHDPESNTTYPPSNPGMPHGPRSDTGGRGYRDNIERRLEATQSMGDGVLMKSPPNDPTYSKPRVDRMATLPNQRGGGTQPPQPQLGAQPPQPQPGAQPPQPQPEAQPPQPSCGCCTVV